MGKIIFKACVVVALVLGASNYMIYMKTGKLPFNLQSFFSGSGSTGFTFTEKRNAKPVKEMVYQWVDENG